MPPGVSKSHVKKRKTSEESEEREDSEEQQETPPLLIAGRQRRTAALRSHVVWDALKPGAKIGIEDEQQQSVNETSSTEKKKKQEARRKGENMRAGKKKKKEIYSLSVDQRAKYAMSYGVGNSTKRPRPTPKKAARNAQAKNEESGGDTQMEVKEEEQRPKQQQSPQKQQPINVIVQQKPANLVVSASKKVTTSSRVYSTQPALKRDQLELIEREMDQFEEPEQDEPSDEEEDEQEESAPRFVLDDTGDEDFMEYSAGSGRAKRGSGIRGRGRGSRGGGAAAGPTMRGAARGRPRGSRGGGIMRGRIIRAPMPMNYFHATGSHQLANGGGIYSLQSAGGIVGELSAARAIPGQAPVVRVLRPAGMPLQSNFQALRPSSINVAALNQQQMAEASFAVNQELENYRGRIVSGSSVQEFNDIIDHLLSEYRRIADDRSRLISSHREYVNHLKLTHQAAQDIKDNKIRHLEQTIEQLQHKQMANIKQEQLRIVKQGTTGGANGGADEDGQNQHDQQGGGGDHSQQQQGGIQQVIVGGSGTDGAAQHDQAGGGGQMRQPWQPAGGGPAAAGQRIRIMGIGGGGGGDRQLPQLRSAMGPNAPYFDDEMDDEEEFEDDGGESAEMDDAELGAQVTI